MTERRTEGGTEEGQRGDRWHGVRNILIQNHRCNYEDKT